ncbi:MAG: O-acetyl-ADP-ribose deacetylase [Trueperella sp.]|uniref:O-acetyl-ADP-ribose deacetylase n=1 Tax=Trueperella sp. TaxID=2699835 RepID=UPI0025D6FC1D|nr:O-acetyl-ADP-ribose deacetylase [Trueperella sp.]MCI7305174.1 O-acetyl-ADP-ribose deacetylase [Trueperella sp.]
MKALHADITTLDVDAIVNAANSTLLGGGGVDGAIHRAAGPGLLAACKDVRRERYPGGLPVGEAVMTPGFNLPARYVIHTVGPNRHRGETDPKLLARAFRSCAELATREGLTRIAYPAISAGVYGWDMEQVARIAVAELSNFPSLDVTFALFSEEARQTWERAIDVGTRN